MILSTVKQNKDSRARAIASGYVVASEMSRPSSEAVTKERETLVESQRNKSFI